MSSTLDLISAALAEVDERVYYGTAAKLPKCQPWNYTVFSREPAYRNASKTGITHVYAVSVVRENFVPEGMMLDVINAMEAIPGMRMADDGIDFAYQVKPGTSDTAEMMTINFTKAVKF
ncbi:MAG: hypothetical protein IJW29_06450 [Clostridia bacterium]|nr:hypothetical protein [Clostridia bacterium]MBQ9785123.1 hypothetical protein [Clostridia bacterium]